MGYLLLNEEFEAVEPVEFFDSLIWTDRYSEAGDFEIFLGLSPQALAVYKKDYYLWTDESEHVMIVEDLEVEKDEEDAITLAVTGRSLESILDRRIVWNQTVLTGSLQNGIKSLLDTNAISPTDPTRAIPGLVFEFSTDPAIVDLEVDIQLLGENLYEIITALCDAYLIGFKITLSDTNQFVFKLYAGLDRSYDQVINPQAVFSPNFDNVGASKYFTSKRGLKSIARIGGEGEDADKVFTTLALTSGAGTGLSRREIYVDSSSTTENGEIPDADYLRILQLEGAQALSNAVETSLFDGEALTTPTFEYNRDFGLGDIVQLEDSYVTAALSKSRVVEFIRSIGPSGDKAYPTLKSIA